MKAQAADWCGANLDKVRRAVAGRLHGAGIEDARLEARHLLAFVSGVDAPMAWLDPDARLSAPQARQLETLCRRREAREPLGHLLGTWGFWSLDLKVSKDVLTPRPETETLVQWALDALPGGAGRILDLGTGSGAIALALLQEWPDAEVVAVDVSAQALQVARENAQGLGLTQRVHLVQGGWDAALGLGRFDLVVSNPPYIASGEIAALQPEVRDHEPALALDGGVDGLDAYRAIVPLLPCYLKPGGRFALETGASQGQAVSTLAKAQQHLCAIHRVRDYGGRDRVVTGRHC